MTQKAYEEHTKGFRDLKSSKLKTLLFLWRIQSSNLLFNCEVTQANHEDAGTDASMLKSHFVRGAACSKAAGIGANTDGCVLVLRIHILEVLQ